MFQKTEENMKVKNSHTREPKKKEEKYCLSKYQVIGK